MNSRLHGALLPMNLIEWQTPPLAMLKLYSVVLEKQFRLLMR